MYCEKRSIPPEELIYRVGMGRRKIVKRIKKNFKNKREKDKTEGGIEMNTQRSK